MVGGVLQAPAGWIVDVCGFPPFRQSAAKGWGTQVASSMGPDWTWIQPRSRSNSTQIEFRRLPILYVRFSEVALGLICASISSTTCRLVCLLTYMAASAVLSRLSF